jgi:hypothetical protein
MRWAKHVACTGRRDLHGLVAKPEGKTPLGLLGRRGEDNIKMDLKGLGWHGAGLDTTNFRAALNTKMNLRVP